MTLYTNQDWYAWARVEAVYRFVVVVLVAIALGGCKSTGTGEASGTVLGGALGGVLGNVLSDKNKAVWTAVGVAAGAFVGNQIGKFLDDRDKEEVAQATVTSADTGEPQVWSNPETGKSGEARVVNSASTKAEGECRDIEQSVTLADGTTKSDVVTACKGPNGWAVQET